MSAELDKYFSAANIDTLESYQSEKKKNELADPGINLEPKKYLAIPG
jgi:hypothetical protein